eukprot:2411042-Rhodomonas_salina.1
MSADATTAHRSEQAERALLTSTRACATSLADAALKCPRTAAADSAVSYQSTSATSASPEAMDDHVELFGHQSLAE